MIHCPDWKTLLQYRFDSSLEEPEDWAEALEHLNGCDSCRIEAYEADPSLLFLDLPEIEVEDREIRYMQQAVATLRHGLELADHDSSQVSVRGTSRLTSGMRTWGKIAASLAVTGSLIAGGVGAFDSEPASVLETGQIATGTELDTAPGVPAAGARIYGLPPSYPNRFPAMPSALPVNWRNAPVVEEVGSPLARIYNYPRAPEDKIALVMIIDPALDV